MKTPGSLCQISDAASEEVLSSDWAKRHGCVLNEQLSNGGCEKWALAVVRMLPGSGLLWEHGHCYVEYRGYKFDSDTTYDALEVIKADIQREGSE